MSPISARKKVTRVAVSRKRPGAAHSLVIALVSVREQRPHRDAQKGDAEDPTHPWAGDQTPEERPDEACGRMVGECREENAKDDRQRAQEARREHQGQNLGFVADLGEADHHGRDEERFHEGAIGSGGR